MENICETKYEKRKLKENYNNKKIKEFSLSMTEEFDPIFLVDAEQSQNMFLVHETDRMVM